MPYPGRPSRGCITCRTRKVKCDETKPTCTRCAQAKRVCLGYRDESELIFRNQNETLGRRKKKVTRDSPGRKNRLAIEGSAGGSPRSPDDSGSSSSSSSSGSPPPPSLEVPIDQRSLCGFMFDYANFSSGGREAGVSVRAYLDFLPGLWQGTAQDSPLRASVAATSLAHLANRCNSPRWRDEARALYAKALRVTNEALRCGDASDGTITAIYMLGTYETITCTPETLGAFFAHVAGLAAMMKRRGRDGMFNTELGRKLYAHHRQFIVITSFQRGERLLDFTDDWRSPDRDIPMDILMELISQIPDLIGALEMQKDQPERVLSEEEARHLQARLNRIEIELESWRRTLPPAWRAQVVDRELASSLSPVEVYDGHLAVYRHITIAAVLNFYRVGLVTLHWIRLKCAHYEFSSIFSDDELMPDNHPSARKMRDLVNEICATIPYFLGYRLSDRPERGGIPIRHLRQPNQEALGGHLAIWPAYVAANIPYTPPEQSTWLRQRLNYIAGYSGIHLARVLAMHSSSFPGTPDNC